MAARMLQEIMPELPQTNVAAAIAHYRDVPGFEISHAQDTLGVVDRDGMRILLIARTGQHAVLVRPTSTSATPTSCTGN